MTKKGFSVIHICIRTTACKWRYDIKSSIIMTTNLQQSVSPVRWNSISTLVQNPPRDICCVSGGSFGSPCRDWLAAGRLRLAATPPPSALPTCVCACFCFTAPGRLYRAHTHGRCLLAIRGSYCRFDSSFIGWPRCCHSNRYRRTLSTVYLSTASIPPSRITNG